MKGGERKEEEQLEPVQHWQEYFRDGETIIYYFRTMQVKYDPASGYLQGFISHSYF